MSIKIGGKIKKPHNKTKILNNDYEEIDYKLSCLSKRGHRVESEAIKAKEKGEVKFKVELRHYKCRYCDFWHVGRAYGNWE